jgi:CBS domain-containing protein
MMGNQGLKKSVRDIMTPEPACVTPNSDLRTVAELMRDHNCGEIPVVETQQSQKLIGVITDRDIACRAVAEAKDPLKTQVRECMSSPAQAVYAETDIEECCLKMEQLQVRRLPVVDDEGRCRGIVAQADIARNLDTSKTARVVKSISR